MIFYSCKCIFRNMIKKIRFLRKWHIMCLVLVLVLPLYSYINYIQKKKYDYTNHVLPVLVLACDRGYLKRCLESLTRYRPDNKSYPIIVSQDCRHEKVLKLVQSYADRDPTITYVQQPDQSDFPRHMVEPHLKGYYRIARHYRFALNYVFRTLQYQAAIVLEDDLEIALDFYEYFRGTYPLLYQDPTIWCVSAWNDNGRRELVEITLTNLLHRTDFFPGLGWMMLSTTWEELEPHWPESYFDDWLRDPDISRGRVCIRPELSRTFNFGRIGVSNTDLFDHHLRYTYLNQIFTPFSRYNLSYLTKKQESRFFSFVYSTPETTAEEVIEGTLHSSLKFVRVPYRNAREFRKLAVILGVMDDLVFGVPRTGLRGVVQCFIKGRRVFLVPKITTTTTRK